jgi:glutamate racemase
MSSNKDKKNSPIGVFDSGVGGLTVAREIIRQMPAEKLVYFGDTARVPYGSKSRDTVIHYSRQIYRFLMTKKVKAIVIACNTASAYALETLASESEVPIIGVIHSGARAAAAATKNGRIGIIGTSGTVDSKIYPKTIKAIQPEVEVIQKACPLLVPLVEEGLTHDSVTDEIIRRYVSEIKQKYIDTLVMGCTHYPLLRSAIRRIMGNSVTLVNPAYETAVELRELLRSKELLGSEDNKAKHSFYVSDLAEKFRDFASSILPQEVKESIRIQIEEY